MLAREHVDAHALDDHLDQPDPAERLFRHGPILATGYSSTRRTHAVRGEQVRDGRTVGDRGHGEAANVVQQRRAGPAAGASHWRTKAPSARWKPMNRRVRGVVDVEELAVADGGAVEQPVVEVGAHGGVGRAVERVVGLVARRAEVDPA